MSEFGLSNKIEIRFNDRFTRCAGKAIYNRRFCAYRVEFSTKLFERTSVEDRENTVIHEVAHIIAWIKYGFRVKPHGYEWQSIHRKLGREPSRCHSIDRSDLRRSVAKIQCGCNCRNFQISKTLYTRRMNKYGSIGMCRKCKMKVEVKNV
jgi:SprT protein